MKFHFGRFAQIIAAQEEFGHQEISPVTAFVSAGPQCGC
jgi:hypothetical protein